MILLHLAPLNLHVKRRMYADKIQKHRHNGMHHHLPLQMAQLASFLVPYSPYSVLHFVGHPTPDVSSGECSAEKKASLQELQEQTTVYMSDMMAGICSNLPYSTATIEKLVGVFFLHLCEKNWLLAHVQQDMHAFSHW